MSVLPLGTGFLKVLYLRTILKALLGLTLVKIREACLLMNCERLTEWDFVLKDITMLKSLLITCQDAWTANAGVHKMCFSRLSVPNYFDWNGSFLGTPSSSSSLLSRHRLSHFQSHRGCIKGPRFFNQPALAPSCKTSFLWKYDKSIYNNKT